MERNARDFVNGITLDSINFATGSIAAASTVLVLGSVWLVNDYRAWIDFGTGGTSPNLSGYWRITKFRIRRAMAGDSLQDASMLPSSGTSYIKESLPKRPGPRPKIISRTLPQRQIPAPLEAAVYQRLHDLPRKYANENPDVLSLDKSLTEGKTTDAIYARPGHRTGAIDKVLGSEIAHVHPAENSLHVWLTEADTKKVVEAGWGERFPLSSLGICDNGWTFVYAPRTMQEVDVAEQIVKAGIAHLTGKVL